MLDRPQCSIDSPRVSPGIRCVHWYSKCVDEIIAGQKLGQKGTWPNRGQLESTLSGIVQAFRIIAGYRRQENRKGEAKFREMFRWMCSG